MQERVSHHCGSLTTALNCQPSMKINRTSTANQNFRVRSTFLFVVFATLYLVLISALLVGSKERRLSSLEHLQLLIVASEAEPDYHVMLMADYGVCTCGNPWG